jgi:hypothetical protein
MEEHGNPDTLAWRSLPSLLRIVRQSQSAIHQHLEIDVFRNDLPGRHSVAFAEKVATP